jgi:hypothetical protein
LTKPSEVLPSANASPTKQFFVNMLVRDIELKDTLLDLLDNCVDGILRSCEPDLKTAKPYKGYRADIVVSADYFSIEDNCGGIPFKIAENSAFAIGKPVPIEGADSIATVGMYGIGMKRAIFKLGKDATVDSWFDKAFRVRISPKWLEDENWARLPMAAPPKDAIAKGRTHIVVKQLHPAISAEFASEAFAQELMRTIAQNYALIIEKGFEIGVRRRSQDPRPPSISPASFRLLQSSQMGKDEPAVAPYVYVGEVDGVTVEIYAGLYRELPTQDEQEIDEETTGSADDAGWTVACNDRVVIWKDRTRMTGWGEATVPSYHGQFIAITGIVLLHSRDPKRLPLTTTKRGIDPGSDVYLKIKDMMREATKGLTQFTNKWKKFPVNLDRLYRSAEYADLSTLRKEAITLAERPYHKIPTVKRFVPKLPTPAAEKTSARISFVALKTDVALLSMVYFGEGGAKPKDVGEEAFKRELDNNREAAE